jgi:hypothetical protein
MSPWFHALSVLCVCLQSFSVFAQHCASSLDAFTPSLQNALIAFYCLDGDAVDSSAQYNNGSAHNVVPTYDRFGQLNHAMAFGPDAYIQLPSIQYGPPSGFTWSVWIQVASLPGGSDTSRLQTIIGQAATCGSPQWGCQDQVLFINSYSGFAFMNTEAGGCPSCWNTNTFFTNPAAACQVIAHLPDGGVPINQWTHLAATMDYSSSIMRLFVNGTLVASKHWNGANALAWGAVPAYLGAWTPCCNSFPWQHRQCCVFRSQLEHS